MDVRRRRPQAAGGYRDLCNRSFNEEVAAAGGIGSGPGTDEGGGGGGSTGPAGSTFSVGTNGGIGSGNGGDGSIVITLNP